MIDELKSDPNVKVNRLDIIGYASPEGTLAANKRLSEGRAMALRDYLAYRYDFPRNQYYIVFGGENWDGLQLIDHLADFSQFLRVIHVFGTNIDFIHLEIQKTLRLNIPLFDFFRFRLQISKLRNHYVRRPYTFQRHFAKLLYVHQFRFAAR